MTDQIKIQWYPTPEAVDRAMWEKAAMAEGLTYTDITNGGVMECETFDGGQVELTHAETIEAMRTQKCWGFVDTDTNAVHVWAADDAPPELVMHLLAHEIGHVTGDQHEDNLEEEKRAEQYGHVAAQAYRLLLQRPKSAGIAALSREIPTAEEKRESADPEKAWVEFWADLCTNEDGTPNLEAIKAELSDYSRLLSWVPKVYMHVTGGQVSYPTTWPSVVKAVHDDHVTELVDEALEEEREDGAVVQELLQALIDITEAYAQDMIGVELQRPEIGAARAVIAKFNGAAA